MNTFQTKGHCLFTLTLLMLCLLLIFLPTKSYAQEEKGTWISYLDWAKLPKEQKAFEKEIDQMMKNCKNLGLTTVYVHAHSHSDSYYANSEYFPMSKFAGGTQGNNPGYDPFGYVVKAAHDNGLKIHAWFNPYRVTGYMMSIDEVSDQSIIKKWMSDSNTSRNVLLHQGQYYLNPSRPEVLDYIVASVNEVVSRYDVDGIQFDDYFYPTLNDSSQDTWFDKPEYDASGSSKSLTQWRRDNVSRLVFQVNQKIKSVKTHVIFGVSPQGYVASLRSDKQLFVDIDEWLSTDKYIDYIMPQIYWGFEPKLSDQSPAPYAFENNLNTWISLTEKSPVKLQLGLALYKGGSDNKDGNTTSEWLRFDDIIARQVITARKTGKVSGYSFYAYTNFFDAVSKKEADHLIEQLK